MVGPICGEVLDANADRETRENRWTPRQVSLAPTDPRAPVLIGIWDTGVDADVLGENMWGNAREAINGLDDDSNGYIDDVHGITLTFQGKPRPGTLRDLGPLAPRYSELVDCYVAQADMLRGVDNDGVQRYKARLKTLDPAARFKFQEDVSTVGGFVHGTHVASIAVAGNPFARVVAVAYGAPDAAADDAPPSRESVIAEGETASRTIDYFRAAGVRVVNMSWQTSRAGLESEMERLGVGGSPAERATLAREWFMEHRSRLESAIRACPEILFVCGAGNSGDDVDFSGYLPAGLRLPNLVAVGAVDAIDRPTSFSSEGSGVSLYALGSDVPGLLPGGRSASFSGTSASAPHVVSLAAKLLAIRPELRPEQVIDILKKTGEAMPDRPGAVVVNPRGAMEAIGWRDRSK
jgi:subtilisin family serine protease